MLAMLVTFVLVTSAHAALVNRGVDTLGNRLIYDDDRDITWYDYSNGPDTWINQVSWAGTLSVDFGSDTYDDWRLPTAENNVAPIGPDSGFNVTGSEMGHLFYTELGNVVNDVTLEFDPFEHLSAYEYWTGTEADINNAWTFVFSSGGQGDSGFKGNAVGIYGLAVRSGDVAAVPEPTLGLLLGISLVGLVGVGAIRKLKQKAAT